MQATQGAAAGQTVYQIQHMGGTALTPQVTVANASNGHQLYITASQPTAEETESQELVPVEEE